MLLVVNPTTVTLQVIVSHAVNTTSPLLASSVTGPRPDTAPTAPDSAPASGDAILRAARDVLMVHGPRRATLAEVARVARVSRMTVYRRFDSLDRLLAEVLTAELAEVLAAGAAAATVGNARERCAATIAATTASAASNPVLQQILSVDPESLTPLMVSRFGRTQRAAAEMLQPLLLAGMSSHGGDGSIRDTHPLALAHSVVLCAQGWVFAAHAIDDHPDGELMWQQWHAMAAGMLSPTAGREHG